MKTFFKFTALSVVLLMLAGVMVSCNGSEKPEDNEKPKEFPLKLSLDGTSCHWINLAYNDSLIIINSSEKLKNHISCEKGSFFEINFSKHTLLLLSGISRNSNNVPRGVIISLVQNSTDKYTLSVSIGMGIAPVMQRWNLAIITQKMSDHADIELSIIYTH